MTLSRKLSVAFGLLVLGIVLGTVALRLAVPSLSKDSVAAGITSKGDESVLADCPNTPNCQGSESSRSNQSVDRFVLTGPAETAIETLANIISSQPRVMIITTDKRYLHATFSTPIVGFIDDVEFLLSDDESSVQVRSASRLGKSDLGNNAKRVAHIRQLVEGRI